MRLFRKEDYYWIEYPNDIFFFLIKKTWANEDANFLIDLGNIYKPKSYNIQYFKKKLLGSILSFIFLFSFYNYISFSSLIIKLI